jgi:hydroxymethylpyrimidine/phosphomethylpyrimidine kinase
VPADFVTAQIDAVFADLEVRAVKIGMVAELDVIDAIAAGLKKWSPQHIVLDPVMVAHGTVCRGGHQAPAVQTHPRAMITPNLPEAAALLETALATTEQAMRQQAERLLALGAKAVLIKGGHGRRREHDISPDSGVIALSALRIATKNTHGTGCSLSSATCRPKGETWKPRYETPRPGQRRDRSRRPAHRPRHGPIHHFHRFY